MMRAARRLAISSLASAFTLALAAPAVAQDSFGSGEGDQVSYPARYDGYDRDRHDTQEGTRHDRYGEGASDRSGGDHGHRPADHPGDPSGNSGREGRTPTADRRDDSAGGQVDESADETTDDQDVSRAELRARARAAERIRRAGVEMALLQQQQMMVVHLERADAYLAALAERIGWSELDPAPKHALLGMIDERRATVADLVEQVQAAETAQELEVLRPATLDPVAASQS